MSADMHVEQGKKSWMEGLTLSKLVCDLGVSEIAQGAHQKIRYFEPSITKLEGIWRISCQLEQRAAALNEDGARLCQLTE